MRRQDHGRGAALVDLHPHLNFGGLLDEDGVLDVDAGRVDRADLALEGAGHTLQQRHDPDLEVGDRGIQRAHR